MNIFWLHVIFMPPTSFRVNLHSIVCLNVKDLLVRSRRHIWSLSDSNKIRTHNHLIRTQILNHLAKLTKWLNRVVSVYLYGVFDCMLLHVTYEFQSESKLYNIVCLNVKELLSRSRRLVRARMSLLSLTVFCQWKRFSFRIMAKGNSSQTVTYLSISVNSSSVLKK